MARTELVLEVEDLTRIQIFCSNPNCSTGVTYQLQTLRDGIHEKCQACNATYPKSLVSAVDHFVSFVENANKSGLARIGVVVER